MGLRRWGATWWNMLRPVRRNAMSAFGGDNARIHQGTRNTDVSSWLSIRRTWNTLTEVTRMKTRIDRKQGMASHLNGVHHHHPMAYDQLEEARNSNKQQPPSRRVDSLFGDPVEHPKSQTLEVQETAVAVAASITRDVKLDTTYAPDIEHRWHCQCFHKQQPIGIGQAFPSNRKRP